MRIIPRWTSASTVIGRPRSRHLPSGQGQCLECSGRGTRSDHLPNRFVFLMKGSACAVPMQRKLRRQDWLTVEDVGQAIGRAFEQDRARSADEIDVYARGHAIKPKTDGQKKYVEAIFNHDLTFCVGPAGTGKTYLAVAAA